MTKEITNSGALAQLMEAKPRLTQQQFKTLRGQLVAGDKDGAMRGLKKILRRLDGEKKE